MRLLVYNIEGKILGKLSMHFETNNSPNKQFNCCSAHRTRKTDNYVHLKR